MRINEYKSIDEFKSEFTGEWSPSNGHWYGLDFRYNGVVYRLNTGSMYNEIDTILEDGSIALFGVYQKKTDDDETSQEYILLGEYSDMNTLLEARCIGGREFKEVIMDDSTQILGKD